MVQARDSQILDAVWHFSTMYMTRSALAPVTDTTMNDSSHNGFRKMRYRAIREHLESDLDTKAVILSLKNGNYYGLNSVALAIWTLLQKASTVDEIEAALLERYEVDEGTCRSEVDTFLKTMIDEGLIEVDGG